MTGLIKPVKITISLSVNKQIHELFRDLVDKEIMVADKKIIVTRNLTDIYNRALEFAVENINEWMR